MCEICLLSHKGSTVISHCPECGMLNVWHINLLLTFTPVQFSSFRKFTSELDFEDRSHPFPDGTDRMVLCTPNCDINFTFTFDEWTDFEEAMEEAAYMQELYQLIR